MLQAFGKAVPPETMGISEYILYARARGILSEDAPAPENDPRVLTRYFDYVRDCYPDDPEPAAVVYGGGYGFYRDPIDDERKGMGWAMATPIVDSCLGVSSARFAQDLPALRDAVLQAGACVLTDSFSFTDGYGPEGKSSMLVRLNSPVADIALPFGRYLESLTSERRKKYRRMLADFEKENLSFSLSDAPLSLSEMEHIRKNLEKKWEDAAGYAYRQTLYAKAVQDVRPQQSLVMRVMDGGMLAFVQTMIVKHKTVFCQSIAKDEEKFYSGLAAFTDFKCIENLCGKADYEIFDPSCRTSLDDPESIGIAKRATVNRDCIKPLLAINVDLPQDLYDAVQGKEA